MYSIAAIRTPLVCCALARRWYADAFSMTRRGLSRNEQRCKSRRALESARKNITFVTTKLCVLDHVDDNGDDESGDDDDDSEFSPILYRRHVFAAWQAT